MSRYSELSGWTDAKFDWDIDYTNNPYGAGCVIPIGVSMCLHYAFMERLVGSYLGKKYIQILGKGTTPLPVPSDIVQPFFANSSFYCGITATYPFKINSSDDVSTTASSTVYQLISDVDPGEYPAWLRLFSGSKWRNHDGWLTNDMYTSIAYYLGIENHIYLRALSPTYSIVDNVTTLDDIYLAEAEVRAITEESSLVWPASYNNSLYPCAVSSAKRENLSAGYATQPLLKWCIAQYRYYNYAYLYPILVHCGSGTSVSLRYKGSTAPTSLADYTVDHSGYTINGGAGVSITAFPYLYVTITDPKSEDYPGYYIGSASYYNSSIVKTGSVAPTTGHHVSSIPVYYMQQIKWAVVNLCLLGYNAVDNYIEWPYDGPKGGKLVELGSNSTGVTETGDVAPIISFDCAKYLSYITPSPDHNVQCGAAMIAICDFSGENGFVMFNRD